MRSRFFADLSRRPRRFARILGFGVLLAVAVPATAAETVRFTFAPGDGTTYVQRFTAVKHKALAAGPIQTDEAHTASKITITRTADGWDVRAEPQSMSMKRDGVEIDNPLAALLSSAIVTYRLDPAGRLLDVIGFDAFVAALRAQLPPEIAARLGGLLSVEALKAKEIAEWNGRIGDYVGLEATIGDHYESTVPYELPNGATIDYATAIHIAALEPCGGGRCVRIEQVYHSDAAKLAELSAALVDAAQQSAQAADPVAIAPGGGSVHGRVMRLIDPATMRLYAEDSERVISMTLGVAGEEPQTVTLTETRHYEFDY